MRQDSNKALPLEARIESRSSTIAAETTEIVKHFQKEGLSEQAMAAVFATQEYLNDLFGSVLNLKGKDKERFILEVKDAIRALVHGMTMGDGAERGEEQLNIANGRGQLRKEITKALRQSNGTGKVGNYETIDVSESVV